LFFAAVVPARSPVAASLPPTDAAKAAQGTRHPRLHLFATKIAIAVTTLTPFEEGRFGPDDPVAHYLPEFKEMKVPAGSSALTRLVNRIRHPAAPRRKILVEAQLGRGETIAPPCPD